MATGDETQAGPPPSLPPRRPPGLGGQDDRPPAGFGFDYGPDEFGSGFPPSDGGLGRSDAGSAGGRAQAPRPQILAPQANEWATDMEEMEVVKGRRTGLVLLFLLALLVVAVIALGLAALSVFRDGDEVATPGEGETATETSLPTETSTTETTLGTTIPDPDQLQYTITEEPFICDGGTRQFAELRGAAPNEQVEFSSPQSSGLLPGTADANGVLPIRWQCDPEQAGTTWELTATGVTSGKTVTFIFAGATTPAGDTTAAPTSLTVNLIEDPFACNNEARIFGGLTGAEPGEQVEFTSPQASDILPGTADADGNLEIRWVCGPDQVGTMWEITATGVTSGRSTTFTLTGS